MQRIALHADLTLLARLSLALARARAVPLAASRYARDMASETPAGRASEPCRKCGGTGEMDPPERFRDLYGSLRFICVRCGGDGTEPPADEPVVSPGET